jgi:hypothetical protein
MLVSLQRSVGKQPTVCASLAKRLEMIESNRKGRRETLCQARGTGSPPTLQCKCTHATTESCAVGKMLRMWMIPERAAALQPCGGHASKSRGSNTELKCPPPPLFIHRPNSVRGSANPTPRQSRNNHTASQHHCTPPLPTPSLNNNSIHNASCCPSARLMRGLGCATARGGWLVRTLFLR